MPRVHAGHGLSKAVNALIAEQVRGGQLAKALLHAIGRVQGAVAAGDRGWAARQELAAAGYTRARATSIRKEGVLRGRAARSLSHSRAGRFRVSARQVKRFHKRVRKSGLPKPILKTLKQANATKREIATLRRLMLARPAAAAAGTLRGGLVRPSLLREQRRLATALVAYATRLELSAKATM